LRKGLAAADSLVYAVGFLMVSFLIATIPAASVILPMRYGVMAILLATHVLGLAVICLLNRSKRRWIFIFSGAAITPIIFVVSGYLSSSVTLGEIVASQGISTYGPHAWSNPFSLVVVFTAVALFWPSFRGNSALKHLSLAAEWMAAVPVASAISACFLGGWLVPFVRADVLARSGWWLALGCVIFVVKTWFVLFAALYLSRLWRMARRTSDRAQRPWLLALLFVISAAGSMIFTAFDPTRATRVIGELLATAMFVTFVTTFIIIGVRAMVVSRRGAEETRPSGFAPPNVGAEPT
jgi:hypothetical protein